MSDTYIFMIISYVTITVICPKIGVGHLFLCSTQKPPHTHLLGWFLFRIFGKLQENHLLLISSFIFPSQAAATSRPPRPKAKPPAMAIIATKPIIRVLTNAPATPSCESTARKAKTKTDHLVKAPKNRASCNRAAKTEARTNLDRKTAITTPASIIRTATTIFGT